MDVTLQAEVDNGGLSGHMYDPLAGSPSTRLDLVNKWWILLTKLRVMFVYVVCGICIMCVCTFIYVYLVAVFSLFVKSSYAVYNKTVLSILGVWMSVLCGIWMFICIDCVGKCCMQVFFTWCKYNVGFAGLHCRLYK